MAHRPLLVFDGGCPFCRHFAELAELRSGIPGLAICDGRSNHALRRQLRERGWALSAGAMLLPEGTPEGPVLHGADAIQWICSRMSPSAPPLQLLAALLATPRRARRSYALLLLARRLVLALRGLPVDPDAGAAPSAPLASGSVNGKRDSRGAVSAGAPAQGHNGGKRHA